MIPKHILFEQESLAETSFANNAKAFAKGIYRTTIGEPGQVKKANALIGPLKERLHKVQFQARKYADNPKMKQHFLDAAKKIQKHISRLSSTMAGQAASSPIYSR